MGSSCFSRGNNRNIEVIQDFLTQGQLAAQVELKGHLCAGECKAGPNLSAGGQMHHQVDPVTVVHLLHQHLVNKPGETP